MPSRPPLEYVFDASTTARSNLRLAQLNLGAELRKELQKTIAEWIEAEALALLCDWIEENREELLRIAAAPRDGKLLGIGFPASRTRETG